MTASLDDFVPPATEKAPSGWEPYSEHTDQVGTAIVKLPRPDATRRDLLVSAGFNPDEWSIKGAVNTRKWMRYDGEWLYYYKFDVVAGEESNDDFKADVDAITKMIAKRRAKKAVPLSVGGDDAFVYVASDWQVGKREGGDGTKDTVERVLDSIDQAVTRVRELRKAGRKLGTCVIAGTGDLNEGTCGWYPGQQFLIDMNRREQNKTCRFLLYKLIDAMLEEGFDEIVVLTVGGNHGENREGGRRSTDDGDNDDVSVFEAVREAYDRAGVQNITWVIPDDELSLSLDIAGVDVGFTHGHLFSGGGKLPQAKALEWWKGQDFGFQAVRGTKILVSSHFHHFSALTHGGRTHLQTPAMDPGSKWVRDILGCDGPPGVLTFRVSASEALGWSDLQVLTPGWTTR